MKPFFASLLRNRRGAACTACLCLVWASLIMLGTWSAVCIMHRHLDDFPGGFVPTLTVFASLKGWTTREDRKSAENSCPPAQS